MPLTCSICNTATVGEGLRDGLWTTHQPATAGMLWPGIPKSLPVPSKKGHHGHHPPWPFARGLGVGFVSTRVHVKMDKSDFLSEAVPQDPKMGLMCVPIRQEPRRATPSLSWSIPGPTGPFHRLLTTSLLLSGLLSGDIRWVLSPPPPCHS